MNKYFKPLDFRIIIPILGMEVYLILINIPYPHSVPKWIEFIFFILSCCGFLNYVKWKIFNFDWMLNIIFKKKLKELNYQYKQQFFHLDRHKEIYTNDYEELNISNSELFTSYQISRVCTKYMNNKIVFCIELNHPGILIGRRGSNIEEIQKELGFNLYILERKDIWFNKNNNIF